MQNINKISMWLLLCVFSISMLVPQNLLAVTEYEDSANFNANFIVSDTEFTDQHSMTLEQIQTFLESKGTLGTYVDPHAHLSAAFIIYNAAKDYGISPKVLLVLLQKEQSLVEDDDPQQKQFDWATGYSCYAGTCDENYKGFDKQVRAAAKRFMVGYWPDLETSGCTFTNWCVGQSRMSQDNVLITPMSMATAALYTYNPYRGNTVMDGMKIGANYNFWKIWQRWFATTYPDGTLIKAENDSKVYLLRNGEKRWITSWATLATRYNPEYIVEVSPTELAEYADGPAIKFPLYALVKTPNGAIYLIADDEKRMIVSWEVFRTIGFNPEEVEPISFADIKGIPSGKPLTLYDAYPAGALLQDKSDGALFYVESGIKYPIVAPAIAKYRYGHMTKTTVTTQELDQYETGDPVKFRDGLLVKSQDEPTVYVISNGKRLPINSEQAFLSYGYKWENVILTTQDALELHPLGEELQALNIE